MRLKGEKSEYATDLIDYLYYLRASRRLLYINEEGKSLVAFSGFKRIDTRVNHITLNMNHIVKHFLVLLIDYKGLMNNPIAINVAKKYFNVYEWADLDKNGYRVNQRRIYKFNKKILHVLISYLETVLPLTEKFPAENVNKATGGIVSFVGEFENALPFIQEADWFRLLPIGSFADGARTLAGRVASQTGLSRNVVLDVYEQTKNIIASTVDDCCELGVFDVIFNIPYLVRICISSPMQMLRKQRFQFRKFPLQITAHLSPKLEGAIREAAQLYIHESDEVMAHITTSPVDAEIFSSEGSTARERRERNKAKVEATHKTLMKKFGFGQDDEEDTL